MNVPDVPATSVTQVAGTVVNRAIDALPGQFLALCIVNVLFLGAVMWFVQAESSARRQFAERVMEVCAAHMEHRP